MNISAIVLSLRSQINFCHAIDLQEVYWFKSFTNCMAIAPWRYFVYTIHNRYYLTTESWIPDIKNRVNWLDFLVLRLLYNSLSLSVSPSVIIFTAVIQDRQQKFLVNILHQWLNEHPAINLLNQSVCQSCIKKYLFFKWFRDLKKKTEHLSHWMFVNTWFFELRYPRNFQ